jgi:hypothetical protein
LFVSQLITKLDSADRCGRIHEAAKFGREKNEMLLIDAPFSVLDIQWGLTQPQVLGLTKFLDCRVHRIAN